MTPTDSRLVNLTVLGEQIATEVDRLWPDEDNPAYRVSCLCEEAGEVSRAVTKRRHAQHNAEGLCRGMTEADWTQELRKELAQTVGVALDIAHRERFDLAADLREIVATLQARKVGS